MHNEAVAHLIEELKRYHLAGWQEMPDIELYMDQVIGYLRRQFSTFEDDGGNLVTPSIINNYVKGGIVPRPVKKKYARKQLSVLIMACLLKGALPMQQVKTLISRDGREIDQAFYADFVAGLDSVVQEEAELLEALTQGDALTRDSLYAMAMCFALRANTDRMIADRLIKLLEEGRAESHAGAEREGGRPSRRAGSKAAPAAVDDGRG